MSWCSPANAECCVCAFGSPATHLNNRTRFIAAAVIDVFVCKIRSKLTKAGLPNVISTVWGRGYSVKDIGDEGSVITTVRPQPTQVEQLFA